MRDSVAPSPYDSNDMTRGSGTIRVLIVDDHRSFAEALEVVLGKERDLDVVEIVTDGDEAIRAVAEHRPDVVLMDASMPGTDGIEATKRIRDTDSDARVIVLTGHESELMLGRAVEAGASGYLQKTQGIARVAESVRQVARGETMIELEDAGTAVRGLRRRRAPESGIEQRLERLTPRELEILQRMADGGSTEQIAAGLGMSRNTLRTHVQNILTKLGVHSKLEALVHAIRHGKIAADGHSA